MVNCYVCGNYGHKANVCQSMRAKKMQEVSYNKKVENKKRRCVDELTFEVLKQNIMS